MGAVSPGCQRLRLSVQGISIHETLVSTHCVDHLVRELAERWSWQDGFDAVGR